MAKLTWGFCGPGPGLNALRGSSHLTLVGVPGGACRHHAYVVIEEKTRTPERLSQSLTGGYSAGQCRAGSIHI